jgi:hypothetical protein
MCLFLLEDVRIPIRNQNWIWQFLLCQAVVLGKLCFIFVILCDLCVILCTVILFVSINTRNCSKSVWYWTNIYQKTFILISYLTTKHMFVDLLKVFSRINMWTLVTKINVHIADWILLILPLSLFIGVVYKNHVY